MSGDAEELLARVALTWLAEPGTRSVFGLVGQYGPVGALDLLLDGGGPDDTIRAAVAARRMHGDPRTVAAEALARTERLGARVVVPGDDEWPVRVEELRHLRLPDARRRVDRETAPPLCFWVRGSWPLGETLDRSVAVVGARAATGYGHHVATDLGYGLADRDWTVVSGGAFGIDAAAHRGALTADGPTVAVLACGVDRPYPMGNAALFDRIADTGLLVSEWMPGAEPLRQRFLIRNRVIAAGTRGTVLVEAAARSGATQTAHRALALARPTMVVPGPVTSAMSVGAHELLREEPATRLVAGLAHVLEEVGRIGELATVPRGPDRPVDLLDDDARSIVEALPRRGALAVDVLAARAGVDLRTALRKLSMLEDLTMVVRRDTGYALGPGARPGPRSTGADR
ncbi:DNA-processing protein DprA [Micromonospora endolithica]|uniref:DNA-processing protein DprA n=1 Tax=Micromonospora endolithica TaxID=230091 RepID=A0A3A9ZP93_9ACTN|nr:DNA-processing protein DprA [Micromonospora endolithica]RKN49317.1 DNA-processing protein DprA [Micromonospora endolithica]TWJ23500.1 DNA processing protein [Micromonospora endolithica]